MTNPNKRRGDRAELEAARILHDLTGHPTRRKLGAGRTDDTGDIDGIPDTVVQVKAWPSNQLAAIRAALRDCPEQQRNANAPFGFSMIRLKGGTWVCVLTPEQMSTYIRETQ